MGGGGDGRGAIGTVGWSSGGRTTVGSSTSGTATGAPQFLQNALPSVTG
jgi:hypothetical protein